MRKLEVYGNLTSNTSSQLRNLVAIAAIAQDRLSLRYKITYY
jgi:hypothetical protein